MLRSMTAFARVSSDTAQGTLVWELRGVNHRFLDVGLRLPEELRAAEMEIRERIGQSVRRGKCDASLKIERRTASGPITLDLPLVEALVAAAHEVANHLGDPTALPGPMDLLRWPGVVKSEGADDEPLRREALSLLDQALGEFIAMREREGERLAKALAERLDGIEVLVARIAGRRPQVLDTLRAKLTERLGEIARQADPARLEQELVIAAQRLDVDEELTRLAGHIAEARAQFAAREAVGRRLDFLMQEFNREANTLGSKAADGETVQAVIGLKVLIEQMREQVQNVE